MNILRSPTRSGLSSGRSDSQPNLSSCDPQQEFPETPKITHRNKRKFIDDNSQIKEEISELRKQTAQIMGILTTLRDSQTAFIEKITNDISDIKNEINDIKKSTNYLKTEQSSMKSDIANMLNKNNATDNKIKNLESEVQKFKVYQASFTPKTSSTMEANFEHILNEFKERETRSKNVIITGIKEPISDNKDERKKIDSSEVMKILKLIETDCPSPLTIFRLGKFQSNKHRSIKVCFASNVTTKSILRNKYKLDKTTISIYSDQTPQQQAYLKQLKEELKRRMDMGEKNLRIKFIKNIPKIIEITPKN